MCGIVGYIGEQDATQIILNGLRRLEYRGYDSSGLAILENGQITVRREVGKINRLAGLIDSQPISGHVGIGHTRWATHGEPSVRNAHPHIGMTGDFAVVHNGIVENYLELRSDLAAKGVIFNSDTDTEVIVHLIERFYTSDNGLVEAVRQTFKLLKGSHSIIVISSREPDKIVAAHLGLGLVIGLGQGENFIASDTPAILEHTRQVVYLESKQMAIVRQNDLKLQTLEGELLSYQVHTEAWDQISAEKGRHRHFMHKEIHEQSRSVTDTIAGRVNFETGHIRLFELNLTPEKAQKIKKIVITACGTAYHAGLVGKIQIERIARIPVSVEIASEFRYSEPIVDADTVVLAISQSGETADTLGALEEGRRKGATLWSIVNALGSQAKRMADGFISMQTGLEIGVASTKAFTAPLLDLYMLALLLADLRGVLRDDELRRLAADLALIPDIIKRCLDQEPKVTAVAKALMHTSNCLYLGRGINMPIAYEGALKLKEISYIHAEGYPAGEMKHGPIALIDKDMPVVVLAPQDPWYYKMLSQIEQVRSRGGPLIAVATEGDEKIRSMATHLLSIPKIPWLLSPVATVIPLQLLAYHIAALRGLDVDQPRNLAKSVTVE